MHKIGGTDICVVNAMVLLLKEWVCLAWILWYTCKTSAWEVLYVVEVSGWKHIVGSLAGMLGCSTFQVFYMIIV